MLIVRDQLPPMYEEIVRAIPEAADPGVHFAWGRVIYSPGGRKISEPLHQHELVHSEQQLGEFFKLPAKPFRSREESAAEDTRIREWWARYLVDRHFRLEQELPAHITEFLAFRKRHGPGGRTMRYLDEVAGKLSSSLYGGIITFRDARDALVVGFAAIPDTVRKVAASGGDAPSKGDTALQS